MSDPSPPDHTLGAIRSVVANYDAEVAAGAEVGASYRSLFNIARHLLDVVGQQREMLYRCEWVDDTCPRCKRRSHQKHHTACALAALLRETA